MMDNPANDQSEDQSANKPLMSFFPPAQSLTVDENNIIQDWLPEIWGVILKFVPGTFLTLRFTCKYFYNITGHLYWEHSFWKEPEIINQQILVIYEIIKAKDSRAKLYPLWLDIQEKIKLSKEPIDWREITVSDKYYDSIESYKDNDFSLFLTDAFRITTLISIDLSFNKIGLCGVKAIAAGLKVNKTLRSINLKGCNIQSCGMPAIAELLKINTALTSMDLSWNRILSDGILSIAGALKVNKTLRSINLYANSIYNDSAKLIAGALIINKSLRWINFGPYRIGSDGEIALAMAIVMREQPIEIAGLRYFNSALAAARAELQERNKDAGSSDDESQNIGNMSITNS